MDINKTIEERLNQLESKLKCQIPDDYKKFLFELEKDFLSYPDYEGYSEIEQQKEEYLLRNRPKPAYWYFHPFIKIEDYHVNKFQIVNLYSLINIRSIELIEQYGEFQSEIAVMMYGFDKEKELFYKDYLPIADNGCGDALCICLAGTERGKIFYCAHEDNCRLLLLAKSFNEFIDHCTPVE